MMTERIKKKDQKRRLKEDINSRGQDLIITDKIKRRDKIKRTTSDNN